MTWKYTDKENNAVSRTLDSGRFESHTIESETIQAWISEGNTPEPYTPPDITIDEVKREAKSRILNILSEVSEMSFSEVLVDSGREVFEPMIFMSVEEAFDTV